MKETNTTEVHLHANIDTFNLLKWSHWNISTVLKEKRKKKKKKQENDRITKKKTEIWKEKDTMEERG